MKKLLASLLLTGCISNVALSQRQFAVEFIGGRLFNKTQGKMLTDFGDGFSIGSGLSYDISEEVQPGLRIVYSEMPYVSRGYSGVMPAGIDKTTSLFFQDEKASSVELSAGLKLISRTSVFVSPYWFIRGGVYFTKSVKKSPSYRMFDDIRPPSATETSSTDGFGAIGAGFRFSLISGFSLSVEGALHKFFAQNVVLVPFLLTTSITM